MFKPPILLIIFNRPQTTQRVFDAIRRQQPRYLYVAADGPRPDNKEDIEKSKATRAIIDQIDWDCELHTLFREENRGCGKGPSEAISWFFDQVDEGLILEDDCVPREDFFGYCSELLERYRHNKKIFSIGGVNFQNGNQRGSGSYYFSAINGTWGWATWKRAWDHFTYSISGIERELYEEKIKDYFVSRPERIYYTYIFDEVKKDRFNESCWDYQFFIAMWLAGGLAILPNKNLVSNIGFNRDATHTINPTHPCANNPTENILPLQHPSLIRQDKKADTYYHKNFIQPNAYGIKYIKSLPLKLLNKIWKLT